MFFEFICWLLLTKYVTEAHAHKIYNTQDLYSFSIEIELLLKYPNCKEIKNESDILPLVLR